MIFEQLEQIDRELSQVSFGDLEQFEALLPKRAAFVALAITAASTEEHQCALRRSRHAAAAAIRQVSLARNLIMQEMSQLTQEQRWQDSMSGQFADRSSSWSLEG